MLSLALGVAMFVSSFESVEAAQTAIVAAARSLSGKADWEVSRGRFQGIDASMAAKIRKIPGAVAAPLLEATVSTVGAHPENFLVTGIDLRAPDSVKLFGGSAGGDLGQFAQLWAFGNGIVVTQSFAGRFGLKVGDSLTLNARTGRCVLPVDGIASNRTLNVAAGGNVGIMAIDEAGRLFGKPGNADKIEVAGASKAQLQAACPTCEIEPPGKLSSAADDALQHIRSLLGISVIALLVGLLLIYNSVQVSVLERLLDIAILRSIGATRVQIFASLILEWLAIGVLGSCGGIAMGSGLASVLLDYTKRTVNEMVPLMGSAHIRVDETIIAAAMAIGVGTTLCAAFFPIWSAATVPPLEILRPYSYRRGHRYGLAAAIGLTLFIGCLTLTSVGSLSFELGLSLTGIEFFGVALLFPQVCLVAGRSIRGRLMGLKTSSPFLALDGMLKVPHRTAFAIMTFGCALMLSVATKTLLEGFKASTGSWINSAFPFDISVMGNDMASSVYGSQVLRPDLADKLRAVAGVRSAYAVRKVFTTFRGQDVMAIGIDAKPYLQARQEKRMGIWPPALVTPSNMSAFLGGSGVVVSDNFAAIYGIHAGDVLRLDSPAGRAEFRVLGQADDYSWQHGAVLLNLAPLRRLWKDEGVSYIDVTVAPGHTVGEVKERAQAVATAEGTAFAYSKAQIQDATDSVLDQAVSMANLQATIAIVIGVLGIVSAVWIGVMNRKREIAMWRAIGITRRQVLGVIVCEGLFSSAIAAMVGIVAGVFGGWFPLRSFSFTVTGYLYPRVVPWMHLGFIVVLALALGLLAGWLPARLAARLPVLESIGYE